MESKIEKASINRDSGYAQKMSEDEIIAVAKFYKNFAQFKNEESNLYKELKRRGIRDKVRESVQKEYGYVKGYTRGRRLTDDFLKETALKYKTLSDFQNEDGSVYQTLRRRGLFKEYTSHIISSKGFSKPQRILLNILNQLFNQEGIYNDRSVIKPFELDIFYPDFNLALEYNGKVWHSSKEDKEKDSRKANLCESVGVNLLVITEVSRDYEKDIKSQLINLLDNINYITRLKFKKEDIESIAIDYDKVYEVISMNNIEEKIRKYNTVRDFRKSNHLLYTMIKGSGRDYLFENLTKRSDREQDIPCKE